MKKKRHRFKRKKSIVRSRFFWFSILIVLFLGGLFYLFFLSPVFQVKNIRISGNVKLPADKIERTIEENIPTRMLFWKTRSIFLVNLGRIDRLITERFPRIKEATLRRDLPGTFVSQIKERVPAVDWCFEEKCFYLDRKGIAFAEREEETGIKIKTGSLNGFSLGDSVIEEEKLQFLLIIEKEIDLDVTEYLFEGDKLTVLIEEWKIYFNLKEKIEDQLLNLKLVLEEKIPPENRKNLEYIDLRFGNRVFVSPPLIDIVDEN